MTVTQPTDLLAGLRDGAWLDAQEFPPLSWAVEGLLPEGFTLLAGPPKAGKSLFDLGVGLAVASGGRALSSIKVTERPVLYLALEDGHRRMQDRCRYLLRGEPIPKGFQYLLTVRPGWVLDTIDAWLTRHGQYAPLVMLDTLGKVMPAAAQGETTYQRDYRIGSALKQRADAYEGTSILTNHHDRKAVSDDFVDAVSGTHGLAGAADTIVVLARPRGELAGVLKITGRDVNEGEYRAVLSKRGWVLDGADLEEAAHNAAQARVTASLGDRSTEIVRHIAEHPEGASPQQIAQALGMTDNAVSTYLRRLLDADRIAHPSRGVYLPVTGVGSVGFDE
jgi:DNA-binding CsgD family transcriptional regulator